LNAVLGWADMLRSGRLSDAAGKRALSAISVNAQRQMQLIAELLDVSRITSGTLRIQTADVDVADVVRKAVDVVEPAALAKNLYLNVEAEASVCRADPGRLQQVVWNLLTNAIKFTPTRGTVDVSVGRRNGSVEIRVRDTGSGIRTSFLPYVFEPFRQADDSTTRREGGLGLGLSIVKHLVEAHGGTITADSAGDGQGSCFTVRLPASGTTPPLFQAASDDQAESRRPTLAGLSVLVVEDDPDSRELLAVALEEAGAKVHVSASARGALESLHHRPVDVVVADIAMPEEDGYAFIRRVRASPSPAIARVRAIALTSLAQEQDRRDAVEAGFQVHLTKPIKPAALADAVARVVHQPAIR
jgi:CheY-like chemotaxis protein